MALGELIILLIERGSLTKTGVTDDMNDIIEADRAT